MCKVRRQGLARREADSWTRVCIGGRDCSSTVVHQVPWLADARVRGMWLAWPGVMGIASATLEMRTAEEHRERLHELVKATRTAVVLSGTPGDEIDGKPMTIVHTGDDTTMYLASSFDAEQVAALEVSSRVTVVLQGAGYAVFSGEARISHDRALVDELW